MKRVYKQPMIELIVISLDDIVTTSDTKRGIYTMPVDTKVKTNDNDPWESNDT